MADPNPNPNPNPNPDPNPNPNPNPTPSQVLEISDGSLWRRLLRYQTKENYMMACALVRDEVPEWRWW